MTAESLTLGEKAYIRMKDGSTKPAKKKKPRWTQDEKATLVKYYDMYRGHIENFMRDYLPEREIKSIYAKVNAMKQSGEWEKLMGAKTLPKREHHPKPLMSEGLCNRCEHHPVCRYPELIPHDTEGIEFGIVKCQWWKVLK